VAIPVLNVDIVETSCPVKVELLFPFNVDREEIPSCVVMKFVAIRVLKVDMVETNWPPNVEVVEPVRLERVT